MRWTPSRPSRKTVFILLMAASGAALFLPPAWSDALKHTAQFLVPPQDMLYTLAHRTARTVSGLDETGRENGPDVDSLLRELAATAAQVEQLEAENKQLRALREGMIPPGLPLLTAKVVARDIAAWRDSLLLERGSSSGVKWRDWAASRLFVDQGLGSGIQKNQAVLFRESLLGRIELVSPYMSRVQLFSDIDSRRIEVRVGGRSGESVAFVDYPCSLRGLGRGRMMIDDVPYQYVQADTAPASPGGLRRIRVGDLVFSAPGQLGLPVPMAVGKVVAIEEDPKKRLVFDVRVEPPVRIDPIREVLIIPAVPAGPIPSGE